MPKSKVFLAWSGPRSREVASALRGWLPNVIQNLEPWMSENDIDKGTAWHKELSAQLQNITTGIICLTPENLREPWINFEAGALSKLEGSHTLTYLFEVDAANVPYPLAGFNATKANKEDTKKLIETLNKKLGEAGLEQARLDDSFNRWWEDLEAALSKAKDSPHAKEPPKRQFEDMLSEILTTLRSYSTSQAKIEHTLLGMQQLIHVLQTNVITSEVPWHQRTPAGVIQQADPRRKRRIPQGIEDPSEKEDRVPVPHEL
jgi:hypothetical protein